MIKSLKQATTLLFFLFLISSTGISCTENAQTNAAAPLGNKAVLEKLASSFHKVVDDIKISPHNLKPEGKRKFVEQVFTHAGFNYKKTLEKLSTDEFNTSNQQHKDLAELVLLPQDGLAYDDLLRVYSHDEEIMIKKLLKKLK